jgi:hypothetical protein
MWAAPLWLTRPTLVEPWASTRRSAWRALGLHIVLTECVLVFLPCGSVCMFVRVYIAHQSACVCLRSLFCRNCSMSLEFVVGQLCTKIPLQFKAPGHLLGIGVFWSPMGSHFCSTCANTCSQCALRGADRSPKSNVNVYDVQVLPGVWEMQPAWAVNYELWLDEDCEHTFTSSGSSQ